MSKLFARRRNFFLAAALATSAGAFTLSACSDDNNDPGTGGISIAVAPTSVELQAGTTGAATYTVARTSPFSSAVALTITGEPASFDVALTPDALAAGETTGTVDIAVAADATPGTYPLTITAAGTGVTTKTTTLTVVVTAAPAAAR